MNKAGDKMVTNGTDTQTPRSRKGGKAGPHAIVKFGSAALPIYLSASGGRTRYILCHYRDGKRLRQIFNDLPAAKKEARFVAQRIQGGMQHVTDLKPHERDNYAKAVELLGGLKIPLVAAVEDYVQARKLWAVYVDGELLAVVVYRKGARAVADMLMKMNQRKEANDAA